MAISDGEMRILEKQNSSERIQLGIEGEMRAVKDGLVATQEAIAAVKLGQAATRQEIAAFHQRLNGFQQQYDGLKQQLATIMQHLQNNPAHVTHETHESLQTTSHGLPEIPAQQVARGASVEVKDIMEALPSTTALSNLTHESTPVPGLRVSPSLTALDATSANALSHALHDADGRANSMTRYNYDKFNDPEQPVFATAESIRHASEESYVDASMSRSSFAELEDGDYITRTGRRSRKRLRTTPSMELLASDTESVTTSDAHGPSAVTGGIPQLTMSDRTPHPSLVKKWGELSDFRALQGQPRIGTYPFKISDNVRRNVEVRFWKHLDDEHRSIAVRIIESNDVKAGVLSKNESGSVTAVNFRKMGAPAIRDVLRYLDDIKAGGEPA